MNFPNYLFDHYKKYLHAPQTTKNYPFLENLLNLSNNCVTNLHVAVIVKRGHVLAHATNQLASRSNGASTRGAQSYIHAERNVLRNVSKKDLRDSSMYVMRIKHTQDGKSIYKYSQPCPECEVLLKKCMQKYGLKQVFFTV